MYILDVAFNSQRRKKGLFEHKLMLYGKRSGNICKLPVKNRISGSDVHRGSHSSLAYVMIMGDSDDTCDFVANLSCSSSSFDEGEPLDYGQVHESKDSAHYEVRPYQFQPERDECQGPELAEENSVHDQAEQRLGSTFWCSCGNCSIKETVEECRCCKEISVIFEKTKELNVDCIINHPGFLTVCLDEYVLEAAYYAYRQQYGNREEILSDRNRYTAYRQLVRWCWGYLGHEIRVALPSCAVDAIRQKFPSEGGNYTGFKHL